MTKRLIDLTDNDLIQMNEEQLRNLIDYECALAGVPLLPKLPIEPKQRREGIEPDLTLYKLGGVLLRDTRRSAGCARGAHGTPDI